MRIKFFHNCGSKKIKRLEEKMEYNRINEKATFKYVLSRWPKTARVFMEYGLPCFTCPLAGLEGIETIEDGCRKYNINPEEIVELVNSEIERIENGEGSREDKKD